MSELLPPRDPKMALREMSARIKIKDIKTLHKLQDRVAIKWYEFGFVPVLFVAALSFLVIVIQLVPEPKPLVRDFVIGSSVALIVVITAILEFLLRKFHAMRRLYEIQSHVIEDLDKLVHVLRRRVDELEESSTEDEDEKSEEAAAGSDDPEG